MRSPRALAVLVSFALVGALGSGCFGYTRPAKRWAYVGNTVLMLGGGAAIAADVLAPAPEPAVGTAAELYEPPFGGALVVGVVLATAGLIGIVFNATRPIVKTSR